MSTNNSVPKQVSQPIFPVRPGSVLSQFLDSTKSVDSRYPTMIRGDVVSSSSSSTTNGSAPNIADRPTPTPPLRKVSSSSARKSPVPSKIPLKKPLVMLSPPYVSPQSTAFENSLRQYGPPQGTSAPTTPRNRSRCGSPHRLEGIRARSTAASPKAKTQPSSKIPSYCGTGKNRPPAAPKTAAASPTTPRLPSFPEPRPAKLAYGVNSASPRSERGVGGYTGNWLKNNKYIPPSIIESGRPAMSQSSERRIRALHTQAVATVEKIPMVICTPLKDETGVTICPCEYEEKACQCISAELLMKRPQEQRQKETKSESVMTTASLLSLIDEAKELYCSKCAEIQAELEKMNELCTTLADEKKGLEKTIEDFSFQNENLELRLFESQEENLRIIEEKESEHSSHSTPIIPATIATPATTATTAEVGIETDESYREKMKFPLDDFLFALKAAGLETDENANKGLEPQKQRKQLQLALAAREGMLNELKGKLKKGIRILQKKCDALKSLQRADGGDRAAEDDVVVGQYREILSPEVTNILKSYKKFVLFMHHYVEESLKDIHEFDKAYANIHSDFYFETKMFIDGKMQAGVFIPFPPEREGSEGDNTSPFKKEEKASNEEEENKSIILETLFTRPRKARRLPMWHDTDATCEEARREFVESLNRRRSDSSNDTSVIEIPDDLILRNKDKRTFDDDGGTNRYPGIAAAKRWLSEKKSPFNFFLNPVSLTKIFNPKLDPKSDSMTEAIADIQQQAQDQLLTMTGQQQTSSPVMTH